MIKVTALAFLVTQFPLYAAQPQQETPPEEMPLNAEGQSSGQLLMKAEQILIETVEEALAEQSAAFQAEYQKKYTKLYARKTFWKHIAVTEAAVLATTVFTGVLVYKITE